MTPTPSPLSDWMKPIQAHVEHALSTYLPNDASPLSEAMRYATLGGGKRVRALLVFAAGECANADRDDLTRAACAVEMMHAYSLVHDDMPCMDNDVLRRGKPTVHVKFGEAMALLAGDALQTQAFLTLAKGSDSVSQSSNIIDLAEASGSSGMCGGQAIDLLHVGKAMTLNELITMHKLKTGALLRVSVSLGAFCGEPLGDPKHEALERYAYSMGLAFQITDDILDATADEASLGKTAGKDALNNKPTFVSVLGLDKSKEMAQTLCDDAHRALSDFGDARTLRLAQLADFIVHRSQ